MTRRPTGTGGPLTAAADELADLRARLNSILIEGGDTSATRTKIIELEASAAGLRSAAARARAAVEQALAEEITAAGDARAAASRAALANLLAELEPPSF